MKRGFVCLILLLFTVNFVQAQDGMLRGLGRGLSDAAWLWLALEATDRGDDGCGCHDCCCECEQEEEESYCEDCSEHEAIAGIHFYGAVPTGDLKRYAGQDAGFGFSMEYLRPVANSPIYLGGQLGYTWQNVKEFDEYNNGWRFTHRYTNATVDFHALARYRMVNKTPVTPYIDAMLGGRYAYTAHRIDDNDGDTSDDPCHILNDKLTLSLGLSGGIEIAVHECVAIDLRATYLTSSLSNYLPTDNIRHDADANETTIAPVRSKLELFQPRIGVIFRVP